MKGFVQSDKQLEGHTNPGQSFERIIVVGPLWVDNCVGRREEIFHFVMVRNNNVESDLLCELDFVKGSDSAIYGYEEAVPLIPQIFDCVLAQSVTFFESQRNVIANIESHPLHCEV